MKRFLPSLAGAAVLATCVTAAYAAMSTMSTSTVATVVPANAVKWMPGTGGMKGTEIAVLYGNPDKAGSQYAVRIKAPDGLKIPPHYHGGLEQATVLQGTFLLGFGKSNDLSKARALGPGSFAAIPPRVDHYGATKGVTILELHGIGPETMVMEKMKGM